MTHSLKNTWITIFSILAMLMSNYVSSAPLMAMNSMPVSISEVTSSHHNHMSSNHVESSGFSAHHQQATNCHSGEGSTDSEHHTKMVMSHCGDSNSSADTCCVSVCSSVSYPIEVVYLPNPLSSTLALHHSIKIGVKVSRIQSLLRPPSA
ncbi:hypothetical protein HGP28_13150 [Vibrio sp. SM6]|uniref:CopL family metal-binding regulatory protein n=1 Tax=Vibrio agarilyticus TaxID=2726741 RepID=A0A7X8YH85_9VIBR|nr:hypothetical protein [Vibrio agarilyticus]NLS13838.1 hypothetical protein [Vibrio agarilyticus]